MIDNNKVALLLASALNEVTGKKFRFRPVDEENPKSRSILWGANPHDTEIEIVRDVMSSLRNGQDLKRNRYAMQVRGDGFSGSVMLCELA